MKTGIFAPMVGILIISLLFQSCMVIPAGERRIPVRLEGPPSAAVQYELINWELDRDRKNGELLVAVLGEGFTGLTEVQSNVPGMHGWHVEIVLEPDVARGELAAHLEEHPVRQTLYVIDDAFLGATLFVFPWVRRIDRSISFHVWNGARPVCTYSYRSDFYLLGGFSSFLAAPFSHRNYVTYDMARIARLFLMDVTRDGYFRSGSVGSNPPVCGGAR